MDMLKIIKMRENLKKASKASIEKQIKKAIKMNNIPKDAGPDTDARKKISLDLLAEGCKSCKAVVLDTNFLLIPEQFKIDIFSSIKTMLDGKVEFMVFDKTIYELQKLASAASRAGISAKVALQLININKVSIITSNDERYADELIVDCRDFIRGKGEIIVATQDQELKRGLKKKNFRVIVMAGKKKLTIA